jgi:L-aspartate oxidase
MASAKISTTDILVIGSGIAGLMAAVSAARQNVKTTLITSTKLFTGSSFYHGTWGMGSVGPLSRDDEASFIESIINVGFNIPERELVKILVKNAEACFLELESYGFDFKKKTINDEEFIPCFDNKQRSWRGITGNELKRIFSKLISELRIEIIEQTEALELIKDEGRVIGVLVADSNKVYPFFTKATILATGGYGGLFHTRLNTTDITGSGLGLGIRAGAKAVNLEFNQFMPGYLKPGYRTVFNEKIFKYSRFLNSKGDDLLVSKLGNEKTKEVLRLRSEHGPFSTRSDAKLFDITVHQYNLLNSDGAILKYDEDILEKAGAFSKIYFDWLVETRGIKLTDTATIGLFFQAANGGLKIDANSATSLPGLYACGEVSGGMHGADRIGGLSSVNGLVFGRIAGKSAANYSTQVDNKIIEITMRPAIKDAANLIATLQKKTDKALGIIKSEVYLKNYLKELESINLDEDISSPNIIQIVTSYRLINLISLGKCAARVMMSRQESRGSFYREDFPKLSQEFQKPITVSLYQSNVVVEQ